MDLVYRLDSSFAMNLFSIYISLVLFIRTPRFVGGASDEDDLTSGYEPDSPKSKSRTHGRPGTRTALGDVVHQKLTKALEDKHLPMKRGYNAVNKKENMLFKSNKYKLENKFN